MQDRKHQNSDEIDKAVSIIAPPLLRSVKRVERDIDPARVATTFAAAAKDFATAFQDGAAVETLFRAMKAEIKESGRAAFEWIEPEDIPPTARPFVNYFEQLDAEWASATTYVIGGAGFFTERCAHAWFEALGHLRNASRLRGGPRSYELRKCMQALVEGPYFTLVDALYRAECLRRDVSIKLKRGGAQVECVARWLPNLVDGNAAHYRNAAAHGAWFYRPTTGAIELFSPAGKLILTKTPGEMFRTAGKLLHDASSLSAVVAARFSDGVLKPWLDAGLVEVINGTMGNREFWKRWMRSSTAGTVDELDRLGMHFA